MNQNLTVLSLSPVGTGLLPGLWQGENAHYWFTKFWSTYTGQAKLCLMFLFHLMGLLRLSCPAAQPPMPVGNHRHCPRLSPEHIPAPPFPCRLGSWGSLVPPSRGCLGTARLPEGCWFWAARGAAQKESGQIWEEAKSESKGARQEHSPSW